MSSFIGQAFQALSQTYWAVRAASPFNAFRRLVVAANHMPQGLAMFDATGRLVVCNSRYLEMYGLSKVSIRPGISLLDMLRARQRAGTFDGDPEAYCRDLLERVSKGHTDSHLNHAIGRAILITNKPVEGGGWVATHDDITEKNIAASEIERHKQHLAATLDNISQGVCMFDASAHLIICNRKYAGLYGLSTEQTAPGTSLEEILRYRQWTGAVPEDDDAYLKNRLKEVGANKPYGVVNKLRDGRFISVIHRPMQGGGWVATHEDVTNARRREESFRLLFENNPVPMWVIDTRTLAFLSVNEAAVAHYGYTREQFLAMDVTQLRPEEERAKFAESIAALPGEGQGERNIQHVKADGSVIDVVVYSRSLVYQEHPARLAAIHDISQIKSVEDELRQTKLFLDTVVNHVPLPIVVKNIEHGAENARFVFFNRAYADLTDEDTAHWVGKTASDVYPKERADIIVSTDALALRSAEPVSTEEHFISTKDGRRLVAARKTTIRDDGGDPKYLLTVLDDVTERRAADERINFLAHHDPLTQLANRAAFLEHLNSILKVAETQSRSFAILYLDLDNFKQANDLHGHFVGDEVLRAAAQRLKETSEGDFIARVGGDEFIVVTPLNCGADEAKKRGALFAKALAADIQINENFINIGTSVGIAVFPHHGTDAKSLIANADASLYQAKKDGRGCVRLFDSSFNDRVVERNGLITELRKALANSELSVVYQPQVSSKSGDVVGMEALMRWDCKLKGPISPDKFIPLAEETGLIVPLGEWILKEACKEAVGWGVPLRVAVNVSPVQFQRTDLVSVVHRTLLETGLSPSRLELEITEGVLIEDFSRAVSMLRRLKAMGIHITMDDFGTGYSSLSYIQSFPFDKIKIDRSFIANVETSSHSQAIVRAITTLARSLRVPVLAEGVETLEQRSFLFGENIDELQGFAIGKPLPIASYEQLVQRHIHVEMCDVKSEGRTGKAVPSRRSKRAL